MMNREDEIKDDTIAILPSVKNPPKRMSMSSIRNETISKKEES